MVPWLRVGEADRLEVGHAVPTLIRLADQGLVEARWQDEPQPGRPRRHLYRLTAEGLAVAKLARTAEPRARVGREKPEPVAV